MTEPTNPNNGKTADAADRVEQGYLTGERAAFAADGVTYVDTIFADGVNPRSSMPGTSR